MRERMGIVKSPLFPGGALPWSYPSSSCSAVDQFTRSNLALRANSKQAAVCADRYYRRLVSGRPGRKEGIIRGGRIDARRGSATLWGHKVWGR
jgi:hypothetical protein